jgi:DNA-binding GntR family transcriptional regulator
MTPIRPTRLALTETDRKTAREQAYQELRRAILGGSLEAGTRLVQTEVAAALRVSTTPVREALRDLAADGLVRFDDYRGAVVQQPDLADIREVYRLRIALEPLAIRQALDGLTAEELERAAELQRQMDTETELGAWVELNSRFHAVFDDRRSPRTTAILRNLRDNAALVVGFSNRARPNLIRESNRQHHLLVTAGRRRDSDAAAAIVEKHVRETLDAMEDYFATGDRWTAETGPAVGAGGRIAPSS